ncbi:MAG: efflux RND transporter periplasmic adaptor subunit [Planctomycetota bacterium]
MAEPLSLRADLVFRPQRRRGRVEFVIEDPLRRKFYRVGPREYALLTSLGCEAADGALGAANRRAEDKGLPAFTGDEAQRLLAWARGQGLIHTAQPEEQPHAAQPATPWNPLVIQSPRYHPGRWLDSLSRHAAPLLSPRATAAAVVACLAAFVLVLFKRGEFYDSLSGVFSPFNQCLLVLSWLLLKVLHELAHAVACQRYGGRIGGVGVLMVLFFPLPYVDVSSCWRLRSKWQRMHVAAAGMQAELVSASAASLVWALTEPGLLHQWSANVVLAASLTTVLFNANPLMRFDGYYLLADLLEMPNLYADGNRWIKSAAARLFFGTAPGTTRPSTASLFARTYGVLAFGWRVFVSVGLLLGASRLWGGAGVVLALTAGTTWFGRPAWRLCEQLRSKYRNDRQGLWRFATLGVAATALITAGLATLPSPTGTATLGIVAYQDDSVARNEVAGFVERVHVHDGQPVAAGQPLVTLVNRELSQGLAAVELKLEASQLRCRQLRNSHELASLEAELERHSALEAERLDLQRKTDALTVRSPTNGRVVSRGLDSLTGRYLDQGSAVVELGDESAKCVEFLIPEQELVRYRAGISESLLVPLSVGGFGSLEGASLAGGTLEPRGAKRLSHPALAAENGGTLLVEHPADPTEAAESAGVELLEIHFKGTLKLPSSAAAELACGRRVVVRVADASSTLGEWLFRQLRGSSGK